jgi:cell division protein FtsQ
MAGPRKGRKRSRDMRPGRKRLWLFAATTVVLLCALAAAFHYVRTSRIFELREVVFCGNRHLTDKELKKIMGIGGRENLLVLSSENLASSLLSSPWVRDAMVRKEFPHRLVVNIREAVPAALLRNEGGMFLVDGKGVVLERLKSRREPFLPVIVSRDTKRDSDAFREALYMAGIINEAGLLKDIKRVEIIGVEDGTEELSLNVNGLLVKIGEGGYRDKLSRLFELTEEIRRRNINVEYVDLRFANRVVVKPVREVVR